MDSRLALAAAVLFSTVLFGWMFRYELTRPAVHQNRFTGAICLTTEECWLRSSKDLF